MKIRILFITLLLFNFLHCGHITSNEEFLFIIENALKSSTSTRIKIDFKLPNDSKGLSYSQFFAIRFNQMSGSTNIGTSQLSFNTPGSASCELYQGSSTLPIRWVASPVGQEHICFCQYMGIAKIDINIGHRLFFNLLLSGQKPSIAPWSNIDFYTVTSTSPFGIILDSGNGFGSGYIFKDQSVINDFKLISITNIEKVDTETKLLTPTSTYTSDKFSIKITMKVEAATLRGQDLLLQFNYPLSRIQTLPTVYVQSDLPNLGAFSLIQSDIDTQVVSGLSDNWLIPNRTFSIYADNLVAGYGPFVAANLELKAYYKNSNLFQSYSTFPFLTITGIQTVMTINHPESWDIYMSGAWPLIFTFNVANDFLFPGGQAYVLLQRVNFVPAFEVYNFIASTLTSQ